MEEELKLKIKNAIYEIDKRIIGPNSPKLLIYMREWLQQMMDELEKPTPNSQKLLGLASGLGRGVTDDYEFSSGPLGSQLLEIVSDIVRMYDPRFQNK
ncbi:hypothetical protein [Thermoflexus hugenholtzii]